MNATEDESKSEAVKQALLHEILLSKVKVICNQRGLTIAEAVTKYGGPGIEREYRKVVEEMHAELGGEGG